MLLLLEFGYISMVQWYRRQQRRSMYLAAVERVLQNSSVIVNTNRIPTCSTRQQASLSMSDTVDGVTCPLDVRAVFQDDRISMTLVKPQKILNISSWKNKCNIFESKLYEINVLLDIHEVFVKCPRIQETSLLIEPLAWESGHSGTSVVFGCSLKDFICLCDQLPEGIHIDEQLQVHKVTTVGVECDANPERILELDSTCVQTNSAMTTGNRGSQSDWSNCKKKSNICEKSGPVHNHKPPNILIYCGKVDSVRRFDVVRNTVQAVVNTDAYTVYHLKHDEINRTPWRENAALLVIVTNKLNDGLVESFASFFNSGGKIISFDSSLENYFLERKIIHPHEGTGKFSMTVTDVIWTDLKYVKGQFSYSRAGYTPDLKVTVMAEDVNEPVIVGVRKSDLDAEVGRAVFSQVLLCGDVMETATNSEMFDELKPFNSARIPILRYLLAWLDIDCRDTAVPSLTPAYLLARTSEVKATLLSSLQRRLKNGCLKSQSLTMQFVKSSSELNKFIISCTHLPVLCSGETELRYFKPDVFWQNLATSVLGQVIIYADVLPTTMAILEELQFSTPEDVGLLVIAGRQTTGIGRGRNSWLSPVGCAMFSLHVRVALDTNLGRRVSFLQHIASLAVVRAVISATGYEGLDLKLKWPNDIYHGSETKLGGVIVNSTIIGNTVHAVIGCGFNVDNGVPTICINDLVRRHNQRRGTDLQPCSTEQLIARTVNHIEVLIADFQRHGHEAFCVEYYKHWLHAGARVRLERAGGQTVSVVGLDGFGFLQVQTDAGEKLNVMPDGNSFDIMHNLISMKS